LRLAGFGAAVSGGVGGFADGVAGGGGAPESERRLVMAIGFEARGGGGGSVAVSVLAVCECVPLARAGSW